jgi:hypothetical protein
MIKGGSKTSLIPLGARPAVQSKGSVLDTGGRAPSGKKKKKKLCRSAPKLVYYVDQHPKSDKMVFIDDDVDKDGVDDVDEDVVEEVSAYTHPRFHHKERGSHGNMV